MVLSLTSLALFTDTAKPITVRVQAGTLNVDLAQADSNGNYVTLDNEPGNILGDEEWEPNQTRLYFFKVENKGDIPLKFTFTFVAKLLEMDGAMSYAVFADQQYENPKDNPSKYLNVEYTDMSNNLNTISGSLYVPLRPGDEKYYAVAIRMKPESGNEYQNKYCEIDVILHAVQNNANV
jgi:hypothetical protein